MSLHEPPPNPTRDFAWWRDRFNLDRARVATYAANTATVIPRALRAARDGMSLTQPAPPTPPTPRIGPASMAQARTQPTGPQQPTYDNPAITSENIVRNPFEAHGAAGTRIVSGLITGEEYNEELQGDKGLDIYRQMWLSDGEVAALMQVLILPLLEADWSVEAAGDDEQDVAIAQFVQDNLFGGMQRTWHETLEFLLLSYLRDGFAVFEKVWAEPDDDGYVRMRKLAPRIGRSIWRWYPNDDDELDRIQQRVWKNAADGLTGQYIYPILEGKRIVVFTRNQEGNNFAGVSVLRAAYKHWFFKDLMEKVMGIMAERSVGIPHFEAPPGGLTQQKDMDAATQVAESLHAGEKTYVVTPSGWKFDFVSPQHGMDLLDPIKYHALQMVRSVLAQFLDLERGGSYALSMDISTFFLQALHATARYIRDQFDRHVIRDLVDMNFQVDRYPSLQVADLDRRDIDRYMAGLGQILSTGFITHDPDTENAIRELLQLPDLPPEAMLAPQVQPTVTQEGQGPSAGPVAPGAPDPTHGSPRTPPASAPPRIARGRGAVTATGIDYHQAGEGPQESQYAALARGSMDDASAAERQTALLAAVEQVLAQRPPDIPAADWQRFVLRRAAVLAAPPVNGHGHA